MTFDIQELNGGITAFIRGRLDTPAAVKAQQEITPLLQNADKVITLDCKSVNFTVKRYISKRLFGSYPSVINEVNNLIFQYFYVKVIITHDIP